METIIIDDDPVFLAVAESMLQSLGITDIWTETNVTSALMTLEDRSHQIELILLDLNMPHIDGLSALSSLSNACYEGAIIVTSGERDAILSSAQLLAEKMSLDCCGALKKPLRLEKLRELLDLVRSGANRKNGARHTSPKHDETMHPVLHYQHQTDLHSGRTIAAEALLRARTSDGQLFGPEVIFQDCRTSDDQLKLSGELLRLLVADLKQLQDAGRLQSLSLNIDASVIEEPEFVNLVFESAGRAGVDVGGMTIELTERELPEDPINMLESLARLGMKGCRICLDDFGAGASNFDLVRTGIFSEIKICRQIVKNAKRDAVSREFITYSSELAASLKMRIVGVGVEEQSDLSTLSGLGIRYVQGFLLGKPEPFDRLIVRLDRADREEFAAR